MANHKVGYTVIPWGDRYKAQITVDTDYDVERAYFDSYREAEKWAKQRVASLQAEYR